MANTFLEGFTMTHLEELWQQTHGDTRDFVNRALGSKVSEFDVLAWLEAHANPEHVQEAREIMDQQHS